MTLNPEVFEKAAKSIARRKDFYACCAIARHAPLYETYHREFFTQYFKPSFDEILEYGAGIMFWFGNIYEEQNQLDRYMALLLCAEICRRENDYFRTKTLHRK